MVVLANIMLAGPIGYLSFTSNAHSAAVTPYSVIYKGDPDLYAPYDARELVSGEITAEETEVIDSHAPLYGAGLGMLIALLLSFAALGIDRDDEQGEVMLVQALLAFTGALIAFTCGFIALIIMHDYWVTDGINANEVQPAFWLFFCAVLCTLPGIGVGFCLYVVREIFLGIFQALKDWKLRKAW